MTLGNFTKLNTVAVADLGKAAEIMGYDGPFAFPIIDVDSKEIDTDKAVSLVFDFIGDRPLIFVGNKGNLNSRVDTEIFQRNDSSALIEKPVDPILFKEAVEKALNWAKELDFEEQLVEIDREEFLPMKIRNFYLYNSFPHDVYMEVTSTKFIKVLKKGTEYTEGEIHSYIKRGIKYFYLHKDDQLKFLENSIDHLISIEDTKVEPLEIINYQIECFSILQQYMKTFGVTESVQKLTDIVIENINSLFTQVGSLRNIIKKFPQNGIGVAEAGVMTSYVCIGILKSLGWSSISSVKKLAFASLIHDCMLPHDEMVKISHLGEEAFKLLSEEEKEEFMHHAELSGRLAEQFSGYPDTSFIIEQHHELPSGDGFPNGWSSIKLTTLSCVFILAHNFALKLLSIEITQSNINKICAVFYQAYNIGNFKEPAKVLVKQLRVTK